MSASSSFSWPLPPGQKARIIGFVDEELALRLLEMGCVPGSEIALVRTAPLGCPLYLQLGRNYLSMRRAEAAALELESLGPQS
ncbi:MAG: ferrous iron transport protein A [Bernardetiaceae bacterium]|jgi:ferrous iron transport protein A|nr:ferrous iron transport protein A [Bernardetiaceae bacterium]